VHDQFYFFYSHGNLLNLGEKKYGQTILSKKKIWSNLNRKIEDTKVSLMMGRYILIPSSVVGGMTLIQVSVSRT